MSQSAVWFSFQITRRRRQKSWQARITVSSGVDSDSINVGDTKTFCLRPVITMSMLWVLAGVLSSDPFFFFFAKGVLMLLKSRACRLCWSAMWATRPRGHSKNVISLVEHINCTCAPVSFQAERTFPGRKKKKKWSDETLSSVAFVGFCCGFGEAWRWR